MKIPSARCFITRVQVPLCYTKNMTSLYSDTHPRIEKMQLEIIRHMPSWKKIAVVDDLNETVKTLAMSGLRERHPNASPE